MPIKESSSMKKRESVTLNRFKTAKRSALILESFFKNGFRSYDAFRSIVVNYYPELSENRLQDFWHFRSINEEICDKIEIVIETLIKE